MPPEKEIVRRSCEVGGEALRLLEEALGVRSLSEALDCNELLCVKRGDATDLFCVTDSLSQLIERIERNCEPLVGLTHAGILLGSMRGELFEPSIHLAYVLARMISRRRLEPRRGIAVVLGPGEGVFTRSKVVGRPLYELRGANDLNLYLVLSERGDPLGWGRIERGRLVPLVDSGWFLRAGG
ncbi:MAG: hypothetical protein QXU52_04030 [Fervidicoccaceae archaeon]